MARILTGVQSTGVPHLGNILGAILPAIELSNKDENDSFIFIANLHTLTAVKNQEDIREHTYAVAAAWIALGLDPEKCVFYRQSDLPEVTELTWYLNCFASFNRLQLAHSFKDKSAKLDDVNVGLYDYPVLMAADILLYDANIVPVGKDQKQHLEITRDLASKVNQLCGEDTLVVPDISLNESTMLVPGIDGQKMSKSYGNFIDIFLPAKKLKKQVNSIVTDSLELEDPKDPDNCTVVDLYKLLASPEKVKEMEDNYRAGGYGYGHAKKALLEEINEHFGEARDKYNDLMADKKKLDEILAIGADKARKVSQATLSRVRTRLGY
ncbi:tryptophan--tRNA ligase [Flavobacteriales bacterium]|jgi:tryptophanyl-tRNA synthetase|nr:tryptophan--tRNA ligase [Flavobacteriales bacterium]